MLAVGKLGINLKESLRKDYSTEDELSAPAKLARVSPGISLAGKAREAAPKATPHANVRKKEDALE